MLLATKLLERFRHPITRSWNQRFKASVKKEGNIRLLFDMTEFKWERVRLGYPIKNLDMNSKIRSKRWP